MKKTFTVIAVLVLIMLTAACGKQKDVNPLYAGIKRLQTESIEKIAETICLEEFRYEKKSTQELTEGAPYIDLIGHAGIEAEKLRALYGIDRYLILDVHSRKVYNVISDGKEHVGSDGTNSIFMCYTTNEIDSEEVKQILADFRAYLDKMYPTPVFSTDPAMSYWADGETIVFSIEARPDGTSFYLRTGAVALK